MTHVSTKTKRRLFAYHVKVVKTQLSSIKANQGIVWSELMTLFKDQQCSLILKKVKRKMSFDSIATAVEPVKC